MLIYAGPDLLNLGALEELLALTAHAEFLAIGQYDFSDSANGLARLGHSVHRNGDFFPRLKRFRRNPKINKRGRSIPFAEPMSDVALFVFGVKFQESMRVFPLPSRHSSLDGDASAVIRGVSVMREERNRNR